MKKYLKIILTIFIIIGNIGCSVTDETTGYFWKVLAIEKYYDETGKLLKEKKEK